MRRHALWYARPLEQTQRPTDNNLLATAIVEAATDGEPEIEGARDPAAVALGRKGGLKGCKARAAKLFAGRAQRG